MLAPGVVEHEVEEPEPPTGAVGDGADDTKEDGWTVTVTAGPPAPLAVVVLVGTMTVIESVPWGVTEPGLPEPLGVVMVSVNRPGEPAAPEEG